MATYSMRRELDATYDQTLARLPELLRSEGFGVLTEIDVKETLKKKIGVDFRRYKILGACNPPFAHKALLADLEVGVMLPCNVVVFEGDNGKTVVSAIDPEKTMAAASGDDQIKAVAGEVRRKLAKVIEQL